MTNEPIGHDIDGLPLWVGDEVVSVVDPGPLSASRGFFKGMTLTVTGSMYGRITLNTHFGQFTHADGAMLRKLHNDHRQASESFTEMLDKLKGEVV